MGNMEWVIGLGVLAVGGWCFLAGPCKGWMSQLNTGNISQSDMNKLNAVAADPQFTNIIRNATSGRITMDEAQRQAQALGQKYKSGYTRLAI